IDMVHSGARDRSRTRRRGRLIRDFDGSRLSAKKDLHAISPRSEQAASSTKPGHVQIVPAREPAMDFARWLTLGGQPPTRPNEKAPGPRPGLPICRMSNTGLENLEVQFAHHFERVQLVGLRCRREGERASCRRE